MSGGHSLNCGSLSFISCHWALDPTKICDSGSMDGSPSTVLKVIEVILPLTVPAKDEPHSLQKHQPPSGEGSYIFTMSLPEIHLKSSGLKST